VKTYAVAFMSFFETNLKIQFIVAASEKDAIKSLYPDYLDFDEWDLYSIQEIRQRFFDSDSMIEVKEVP
jgi:hypothetical protein